MTKEWKQTCKDCGKKFGYSDISLQNDLWKGFNRAERCESCRKQHSLEIKSIASSHFEIRRRITKPSILGYPYLGQIEHGERIIEEIDKIADKTGMDIGLNDNHIKEVYDALKNNQVLVIVAPTGTGKSTFLPSKFISPLEGYPIDYFTKNGPIIVTQPRIPATRDIPKTVGSKLVGSSVGNGFDIGYRHGDKYKSEKKYKITENSLKELTLYLSANSIKQLTNLINKTFNEINLKSKLRQLFLKDEEINEVIYYTELNSGENYDRKRNRLIFVTDGSLLNWIEEGHIADFSMIIVDEAHERSCNIDLIIGLVKRELLKYPHLKLIIASATIDADSFVNFFTNSISVKKMDFSDCQKTYGYDEYPWKISELKEGEFSESINEKNIDEANSFLKQYTKDIVNNLVNSILEIVSKTKIGGILGFLDGEERINAAVRLLNEKLDSCKDIKVFPLYTNVGYGNIEAALAEMEERRIVIATNIAETSLTIRDVVYVVDSGLIKQSDWNSITCRRELNTKFHSKDGCKQRWGRSGRVQKGFVYKLYTKEQFVKYFPNHTPPEIKRSNAESIILGAMASGISDIENFSLLENPKSGEFDRAFNVIKKRNIIDQENDFTDEGREVYRLSKILNKSIDKIDYNSTQRSLDIASFLILADKYSCLIEAATIICMMPKMGNALFWENDGLIIWDKDLNLISKDYKIRMLDSFKAGCIDDLDFACKLFSIYEGYILDKSLDDNFRNWFLNQYSINIDNFETLYKVRNELIEIFTERKTNNKIRRINWKLITKVRILASLAWPDRIARIKKNENVYFEFLTNNIKGIISDNCAGSWQNDDQAVVGILNQNATDIFVNGKFLKQPIADFLIRKDHNTPQNNPIDIISSYKTLIQGEVALIRQINWISDLTCFLNEKCSVSSSKNANLEKTFPVIHSIGNVEETEDYFIKIVHDKSAIELNSELNVRIDVPANKDQELIIEKWILDETLLKPVLIGFKNYDIKFYDSLQLNSSIKGIVRRPIYNFKPNGIRDICGFILLIDGFHCALDINLFSIEPQYNTQIDFIGKTIELIKIGEIESTKLPILSTLPFIEKERQLMHTIESITGRIIQITKQQIIVYIDSNSISYNKYVSISTSIFKTIMNQLELDDEISFKTKLKCDKESRISVDFSQEKEELKQCLIQIKNSPLDQNKFFDSQILFDDSVVYTNTPLQAQRIYELIRLYPNLKTILLLLYSKSWQIITEITSIQKVFNEICKEVYELKSFGINGSLKIFRQRLKDYEWRRKFINYDQRQIIKNEIDQMWDNLKKREKQLALLKKELVRDENYLKLLISRLNDTPDYHYNKREKLNDKIYELNMKIDEEKYEISSMS